MFESGEGWIGQGSADVIYHLWAEVGRSLARAHGGRVEGEEEQAGNGV